MSAVRARRTASIPEDYFHVVIAGGATPGVRPPGELDHRRATAGKASHFTCPGRRGSDVTRPGHRPSFSQPLSRWSQPAPNTHSADPPTTHPISTTTHRRLAHQAAPPPHHHRGGDAQQPPRRSDEETKQKKKTTTAAAENRAPHTHGHIGHKPTSLRRPPTNPPPPAIPPPSPAPATAAGHRRRPGHKRDDVRRTAPRARPAVRLSRTARARSSRRTRGLSRRTSDERYGAARHPWPIASLARSFTIGVARPRATSGSAAQVALSDPSSGENGSIAPRPAAAPRGAT